MRNPLLFSSDLLVKRATAQPFLPAYTPPVATQQNQIDPQAFWNELQKYPEDVQREEYTRAKYGPTTQDEINRSKQMSEVYNPTPAAPTTDRWGRALKPAPLTAGEQYQKDWVSGKFEKDQQAAQAQTRNTEAQARGQARIDELTRQHGQGYWEGAEGKKDLERYQKGLY